MKNKKILLLSIVGCVFVLTSIFNETLSFFKDEKFIVNKLSYGEIDVDIEEDFDKNPDVNFDGSKVKKKIWIENDTNNPALVRVSISTRWINTKDEEEVIEDEENLVSLNFKEEFNSNGESDNWYKSNDGYYYYKNILEANGTTAQLLDSVTFNKTDNPLYKDKEFRVEVKAEAVQPNKVNEDGNEYYVYEKLWLNILDFKVHEILKGIVDNYKI
ncbi:MAG: hypothetical protein RSF37_12330 [Clostridium sp.]|uniref:hypothetical protein n=1 Tax=Clostridium sp. TaxID=1506 RepID=UPI002FCACB57